MLGGPYLTLGVGSHSYLSLTPRDIRASARMLCGLGTIHHRNADFHLPTLGITKVSLSQQQNGQV